jgi:hypothetical protein
MGIIWTTLSYASVVIGMQAQPASDPETPKISSCYASEQAQKDAEAAGQVAPVQPPGADMVIKVEASPAERFLEQLETADRDLRTLRARVLYDRVFELQGDRQKWEGTLVYESGPAALDVPARRRFLVRFEKSQIGNRVDENDKKQFLFDGRWFVERNERLKTLTRREVVAQGQAIDPMRLGDSPFPLPIGQKKADILSRYDVRLLEAGEDLQAHEPDEQDALAKFVEGCTQIVLTPKPEERERSKVRLDEVRLWYKPAQVKDAAGQVVERWLPRMARTVNKEGVTIVQLVRPQLNEGVTESDFTLEAGEGWLVQEDKLQ